MNIIEVMDSPALFQSWFAGFSWNVWRVFLRALFALPFSGQDFVTYAACTGRRTPPKVPLREGWLICGRRSGKSRIMALVGTFLAAFHDYSKYLSPGERGLVAVIAADREQAQVILGYIRAFFEVPMLKKMVDKSLADGIILKSGITVRVTTASMKLVRGYTIVAALCDEMASWRDESSQEPDKEILAAIRPGMVTIPNAILLCGSSPYARRGELYRTHQRFFGKENLRVLVWQAPTTTMNPLVDLQEIEEARLADPASAAAEYDAQFRLDVEEFVAREAIAACTSPGVLERAPDTSLRYAAFCDPSGGTSDAMVLAIGHLDKDGVAVLDATYSRQPPFSPEGVCSEFAMVLKRYGLTSVEGDHFAGQWPIEQFKKHGITYVPSSMTKRDIYLGVLPLINSMKADLLDNPMIGNQFCALERKQSRGGREIIDHPLNAHDDLVNAISGCLVMVAAKAGSSLAARVPAVVMGNQPPQTKTPGFHPGGGSPGYGVDTQEPRGDTFSDSPFVPDGGGVFVGGGWKP